MTLDTFILIALGLLGLVMGSAITAIAHRVPRDISWVRGRSACPACGHTLGPLDLVPILSWLSTRGRCRYCGTRVSFRYPLTELMSASWAVLLYVRLGGLGWDYALLAIWGFLMIALLWIDLDFQLLPDALTFPGTLIGLAAALQWPGGARHALFGILLGSGLLWLLAWGYYRVRRIEGMLTQHPELVNSVESVASDYVRTRGVARVGQPLPQRAERRVATRLTR